MFKILLSKLVLLTLLMLRMPCFALEAWAYFIEQARQLSLDNCCLEYVDKLLYSSSPFKISLYFLINDNNGNKITISLLLSITNFGQIFEPLMQFVDIYILQKITYRSWTSLRKNTSPSRCKVNPISIVFKSWLQIWFDQWQVCILSCKNTEPKKKNP